MLCPSFMELTPLEQSTFVGKVVHLISQDEKYYQMGMNMIKEGENDGLFKNVVINPLPTGDETRNEDI